MKTEFVEFEPTSRLACRKWLEQNHKMKKSIWLIIAKGSGLPVLTIEDVVDKALCFGWIDSVPNKVDGFYIACQLLLLETISKISTNVRLRHSKP